jgi:hypothetical protein
MSNAYQNGTQNQNGQQFDEQTFVKTSALVMPSADLLNSLEEAEVGMAMRAKYWTPTAPGEKIRAYFTGMGQMVSTDMQGKQREVPAANFVGPNGAFIHAGTTLIDQVLNLPPGTPVEIVYEGVQKNKTNAGQTKVYVVRLLNAKPATATMPARPALPKAAHSSGEINFPLERIAKAKPHVLSWSKLDDVDGNRAAAISSTYESVFADIVKMNLISKAEIVSEGDSSQVVAEKAYQNLLILESALRGASDDVDF